MAVIRINISPFTEYEANPKRYTRASILSTIATMATALNIPVLNIGIVGAPALVLRGVMESCYSLDLHVVGDETIDAVSDYIKSLEDTISCIYAIDVSKYVCTVVTEDGVDYRVMLKDHIYLAFRDRALALNRRDYEILNPPTPEPEPDPETPGDGEPE